MTRIESQMSDFKQVIVARMDLGMGKGKLAAQVAHASVTAAEEARTQRPDWFEEWWRGGQEKVVVRAAGEPVLRELLKTAKAIGLPSVLIQDAGLTQLEPGTATCLGVGPGPSSTVDRVTGQLKLL